MFNKDRGVRATSPSDLRGFEMSQRSQVMRFVVACATSVSLIAGVAMVPTTSANAVSVGIGAKKKVLTTEQKNAKAALDKASKDLTTKEKNLAAAIKSQAKAAKALEKATAAAEISSVRNVKSASKKAKAKSKAAAAALKKAKLANTKAASLVARRTVLRDIAQAKVIRLDAKYAWLINDISTLDCGAGTDVVSASGALEHVWECGIVYMHEDGDTTHVKTTANKLVEVRNIGLQTPEMKKGSNPAQCGATQAYENFKSLMPEEITIVQLRSLTNGTNNFGGGARPTRSVYKLNNATGAFDIDVQTEQLKAGWSMWWPNAAEWVHNKEYLDLMNDAKARGVGLWNPSLCGPAVGEAPLIWFNQNAPTIGSDTEPAFGEYVILYNQTTASMDLTGWSLRDDSLNFFWNSVTGTWMQNKNKFGALVLKPGEHKIVYIDNPAGYPLSPTEYEYFNWSRNAPGAQLTNGSINGNYANGDGIYMQDKSGNMRVSMTNPCTSTAMCATPKWVTDIISTSRANQIIPIPVALTKVANVTRDRYNPVVTMANSASITTIRTPLLAKGYDVSATVGTPIDSVLAPGTPAAIATAIDGANVVGTRVGIADLLGTTRTKLWIRLASGYNTFPSIVGLTTQQATDALTASGFKNVTTVTGESVGGVSGTVASLSVDGSAPGTRHLLTSVIVLTVNP
ncbi:unannotated protein [freshwater metagenome]|uniref:Unannotated protein n=2 Tax=freshwater metagenome TaxID=449393 RepID=A0A6J7SXT2_9ZZZZ|nr:PASTA domain-containing protein [Actinomycetota bacterium]MSW24737.1 PASTA domain-containing protein [Actinomycetota bacterium]MSX28955.1 PASTA domain-containing protein [Actinomycetota bacterium]MSX42805.1 PASTA domain-containing protein [Actinomycetota bacterium]MSX96668.1 PASTA domain-containing protein [Actinomycetota bacterium]